MHPKRPQTVILVILASVVLACGGDGGPGTDPAPEPKAPKLTVVSGDHQRDTVGRALPLPLTMVFKDTLDQPISGATVTWGVVSGGGSVAPATSVTGPDGQASTTYTLGPRVMLNSVRAFSPGAAFPVYFSETSINDVATQLIKAAGDTQYTEVGQPANPYAVKVADQFGNGVPQMLVQWAVTTGGGSVAPATSVSDTQGIARTTHTPGAGGDNAVTATLAASPSAVVTFNIRGVIPATLVYQLLVPANYGAHDTFVRDGIAFHCAWNTGVIILDVGNGMRGGSPTHPVEISRLITNDNGVPGGPAVHNAWWFHNPVSNEKRYLFIGQEGIGVSGSNSSGDIHVVDVSDLSQPVEVGYFTMPGAGTHNFWVDEPNQILYAAYYNGGVVAIDVSGTLQGNISNRLIASVKPGGSQNTSTWGVQLSNGFVYASDILSGFYQLKLNGNVWSVLGGGHNINSGDGIGTDLWVANGYAYTGFSGKSKVLIWKLNSTGAPVLVDSIPAPPNTFNLSDVEVSPSGRLLMFSTEGASAGYYFYNLSDPEHPKFISRYLVPTGLHTATFGAINNRLYAFGAKDPPGPAMLILDVTTLDF